ncbi:MAG: sulfurtransferase [Gammaproteobacteria bacterium]|nr:sulfurtransferase [Gammaproteobacteria bacterium]
MPAMFPIIVEAAELKTQLGNDKLLIVDLSSPATYVQYHIPGAVFLNYEWIVRIEQPRMGLLPTEEQLNNVLGSLGLSSDTHVVAYDDEGGGRASRFLWTLDVVGHKNYSLLNGGLQGWSNHGNAISSKIAYPTPCEYTATMNFEPVATRQFILDHFSDDKIAILDTRNPAEFNGIKVFAQRGGHIPGAVNIEWTDAMDKAHDMRLKSEQDLRALFEAQNITRDKTIVVHCQTHHRSAHTYIVLKSLGYENVKGYPGSWSDWGNEPNTPIE